MWRYQATMLRGPENAINIRAEVGRKTSHGLHGCAHVCLLHVESGTSCMLLGAMLASCTLKFARCMLHVASCNELLRWS